MEATDCVRDASDTSLARHAQRLCALASRSPGIAAADELDSRLQFELRVSGAFRLWWIYAQTQHVARQLERGYLEEIERALADC